MPWTSKIVFKATDSISSKITLPTYRGVWIQDIEQAQPPPPYVASGLQEQIDDITDSIESEYCDGFVFDQWQEITTGVPFYFYWEVPLGTVEIVSARVSFEVKSGTGTITFTCSEDKGALYGDAYGPYTTDMRDIDITGDLTGEGIKIMKLTTSATVVLTARVFLRIKVSKKEKDNILKRPEVRTLAATSVADVSATLNGDIISVGGGNITDRTTGNIVPVTCIKRGFKYGLTQTDTWDTNTEATYVRGTYGISATSLTPATDYYFRAYADNQNGRSYGEYMKLTTLAPNMIASIYGGRIYTSAIGTTWTESRPVGDNNKNWRCCSISGAYMIVGIYTGRLYTSSDYGASWNERQPAGANNKVWRSCAVDGAYMIAGAYGGRLYTSANYGVTWTERQPAGNNNKNWYSCSVSGAYMIAGISSGRLYTSSDYGITWTERYPAGVANKNWRSCSTSGAYMIAAIHGGRIYTSSNYGVNWTQRYPAGVANKNWLCCSVSGAYMIIGVNNGRLYTSSDYGVTWAETQPAGDNDENWYSCSVSDTYMIAGCVAGVDVGRLYTSADYGVSWTERQPAGDSDQKWYSCSV